MKVARSAKWLLAAYPPHFRARYGGELEAVLEELPTGGPALLFDLARGALRAWISPAFGSGVQAVKPRLQATVSTVFVAFSVALFAAAGFARAVDDAPVPGLRGGALAAFHVSTAIFSTLAVAVAAFGLVVWTRLMVRAWRASDRRVIVLAALPAVLVAAWLAISWLMGQLVRHTLGQRPTAGQLPWWQGLGLLLALLAYATVTVLVAGACVWTALKAFRLAPPTVGELRLMTTVTAVVGAGLLVEAVARLLCLLLITVNGGADLPSLVAATLAGAALLVCGSVSTVSSARGLRAAAAHGTQPQGGRG